MFASSKDNCLDYYYENDNFDDSYYVISGTECDNKGDSVELIHFYWYQYVPRIYAEAYTNTNTWLTFLSNIILIQGNLSLTDTTIKGSFQYWYQYRYSLLILILIEKRSISIGIIKSIGISSTIKYDDDGDKIIWNEGWWRISYQIGFQEPLCNGKLGWLLIPVWKQ